MTTTPQALVLRVPQWGTTGIDTLVVGPMPSHEYTMMIGPMPSHEYTMMIVTALEHALDPLGLLIPLPNARGGYYSYQSRNPPRIDASIHTLGLSRSPEVPVYLHLFRKSPRGSSGTDYDIWRFHPSTGRESTQTVMTPCQYMEAYKESWNDN